MTADGIDEFFYRLARGIAGGPGAVSFPIQRALDQLYGILTFEMAQFPSAQFGIEWRGQGLAAGEDEPRVALRIEPRAELEDRIQLAARVIGEGLWRLEVGRQEDALHVVHH